MTVEEYQRWSTSADWDRDNIPNWTDFDEHEAQQVFELAFKPGTIPTPDQKLVAMRMSRYIVDTHKMAKFNA